MEIGTQSIAIERGTDYLIRTDGEFRVYGVDSDGVLACLIGPPHTGDRQLRVNCRNPDFGSLLIEVDEGVHVQVDVLRSSDIEKPYGDPLVVTETDRPTLEEKIKRLVADE